MRRAGLRPFVCLVLPLLAACGSITDPSGSPALFGRKPAPPPRPTILFVHGYNSSAGVWGTMIGRFKRDGWQASQLVSFSYNTAASNITTAGIIQGKVDSIVTAGPATQVTIVGHSMGTLSARYYVRNFQGATAKVAAVVSLAGANHGTNTAIFCSFSPSCQEMTPGSSFLTTLNSIDETWGSPRYATWWSPCDEVINPRSSALLADAANTQTACMQHSQLHEDATVYSQVRAFVDPTAGNAILASAR